MIHVALVLKTLCNISIQPSPDRRFCGVGFWFPGRFAFDDERFGLLTRCFSRPRFACARYRTAHSGQAGQCLRDSVSPTQTCGEGGASAAMERMPFVPWANAAECHCHIRSRQCFRQPICELDEACLTGDRLRLDRLPATTSRRFLTPDPSRAPPLPLTNLRLSPSISLRPNRHPSAQAR